MLCYLDNNPHVQEVINLDLVRYFVEALKADDCPILQVRVLAVFRNALIPVGSCLGVDQYQRWILGGRKSGH